MASIAAQDEPGWTAWDTELRRDGPSFTFDTLAELHRGGWAAQQIFFITGTDAFAEIATWSRYPAVLDLSHFVVVTRPGTTRADVAAGVPALAARVRRAVDIDHAGGTGVVIVEAATPAVSSTDIRARAAQGTSLAGLVPVDVEQYIRRHGLYGSGSSVEGALHGEDQ
jgi:nicotinate-nucleotide adenylyltransferase